MRIVKQLFPLAHEHVETRMTEQNRLTQTERTPARPHECAFGESCQSIGEGHALSFMQRRLASSTPTKWRDALVTDVTLDGRISVTTVDDGLAITLWHHAGATGILAQGDPVAVHAIYHVLSVGQTWLNVAEVAA
jgi:hypothetical protein